MSKRQARVQKTSPVELWHGAGWFNFYFLIKFALAYTGYINLIVAYNALLFAFVLIPIGSRLLNRLRDVVASIAALSLIWHESWLPGPQAILQNVNNLANFSLAYLSDLVVSTVNPAILAWLGVALVAFMFLRHWIRFSAVTTIGLFLSAFPQTLTWLQSNSATVVASTPTVQTTMVTPQTEQSSTLRTDSRLEPVQSAAADSGNISKWFDAFHAYESERRVKFPTAPVDLNTSGYFDIAIVNICSLSNDDLAAAGLNEHPVLNRFDIRFTNFNSGTAYSGPATLRLLRSACGQYSHSDLYEGRQPDCEILNKLNTAGWSNRLYMDHNGQFDNYLSSLRNLAGLEAPLASQKNFHRLYDAFDDSPIYDAADVFEKWRNDLISETERTVSFFNLVALHDGNRDPRTNSEIDFKIRARSLLDKLNSLMDDLDRLNRPILFVVVPEHGAAYRGDKIQLARLREIPSPSITHVPVMVKFYGIDLKHKKFVIEDATSYTAVAEMINRVIRSGVYAPGNRNALASVESITRDLPLTWSVSENSNARVLEYASDYWVNLRGDTWMKYPK